MEVHYAAHGRGSYRAQGQVHLLEPISLSGSRRALVTILEEEPGTSVHDTALLSEAALAEDGPA
jgi:hypothetical protein